MESTSRRTGLQLGLAAVTEANTGDFSVKLKRKREPRHRRSHLRRPRQGQREYPQLDVEFIQVLQDMIGDLTNSPEPIEIKLFSQDPALLKKWAPKVGDRIKKIKAVVDVKNGIENTISGPAIVMNVDPVVAARAGFHAAGNRTRCQRHSARRARDHAGGRERPLLHDPRALPGEHARHRSTRSATP